MDELRITVTRKSSSAPVGLDGDGAAVHCSDLEKQIALMTEKKHRGDHLPVYRQAMASAGAQRNWSRRVGK
jgi:hypothetical protein